MTSSSFYWSNWFRQTTCVDKTRVWTVCCTESKGVSNKKRRIGCISRDKYFDGNFGRYFKTCILLITCRTHPQKIGSSMIVHGNSDLFLTTYWSISKKQCSLNLISQLTSTRASSKVRFRCASTWKTSQSSWVLNFGFIADKSQHIYTSLTWTWERKRTLTLGLVNQLYYHFVCIWRTPIVMYILIISSRVLHSWQSY